MSWPNSSQRVGGRFTHNSAGRAPDLGTTWFRSKTERNVARYLNFLVERRDIQSWEYEPITFDFVKIRRGCTSYTPDFRVTKNDGTLYYIEVKGWMDDKSRVKLNRMAKYFPDVVIQVIDSKRFRAIAKWKSIIKHWE